jgi:hypothetical protein
MNKHTPAPWKAIAQGGSSTVVSAAEPARNDTRIPPYGYRAELGYCIGYPFIDDDRSVRHDFVNFSHADAKLIAAAPELLATLQKALSDSGCDGDLCMHMWHEQARAVIAKATE